MIMSVLTIRTGKVRGYSQSMHSQDGLCAPPRHSPKLNSGKESWHYFGLRNNLKKASYNYFRRWNNPGRHRVFIWVGRPTGKRHGIKQLYIITRRRVVIWADGTRREGIVSLFGLVDRPENVMALFELVKQPFILGVMLLFGPMEHTGKAP